MGATRATASGDDAIRSAKLIEDSRRVRVVQMHQIKRSRRYCTANCGCHRGSEVRQSATAIALLCVSSTVLAHDIYSDVRDRDGNLCCNGQDSRPVEATVLPNGNYYLPASNEINPAEMATPSP